MCITIRCIYYHDHPTWSSGWLSSLQPECQRSVFGWLGKGKKEPLQISFAAWYLHRFLTHYIYVCLSNQAKRTLKNLRVKTSPTNTEYKITGLSDKPCNEQLYVFLFLSPFSLCVCVLLYLKHESLFPFVGLRWGKSPKMRMVNLRHGKLLFMITLWMIAKLSCAILVSFHASMLGSQKGQRSSL